MQEMRNTAGRSKIHRAVIDSGLHGRIDQRSERRRFEENFITRFAIDRQSCPVPPSGRYLEVRLVVELIGRRVLRIKQELVPAQHGQLRSAGTAGRKSAALRGQDVLNGDIQRRNARGNVQMELVHVDVIPAPRNGLAICRDLDAGQVFDRTSGAMLSGNPFRIEKRQRAGLHGKLHGGMDQTPRGF